jgi:transcription initiation factor TFIIB
MESKQTIDNLFNYFTSHNSVDDLGQSNKKDIWDCFKEFDEKTDMILDEDNDSIDNEYKTEDEQDEKIVNKNVEDVNEDNLIDIEDDEDGFDNLYSCSDCKTYTLIYKDGQNVCTKCGLMQQKTLTQEAEYRCYSENNKGSNPERVGMPTNTLYPQSSLGTLITHRSNDKKNIKRMIKYNEYGQMTYSERSLYKVCSRIATKSNRYGIPNIIIERAKDFYNIIKEVNITRGDNRDGLIAACIYFACKDENVPRSSKEIATIFDIKLQDMTKGIKNFRENWRLAKKNGEKISLESSSPIDYIDRYCSNLPIAEDMKHIAEFIAAKSIFYNLVDDNTAPSIAAGSIFLACSVTNQNINKKQVADACKTSEVTISKCFKKLNDRKLDLIPKSIAEKYNVK